MSHQHFIGYGSLEDWLQAVDRSRPVYATDFREPGRMNGHGLRTDLLLIVCAQPDADGHVHYCRLRVGSLTYIGDTQFDPDHDERLARQQQAWEIVYAWLAEQNLVVREAIIAHPTNLRWFEGWADFLRYDKESKQLYRADRKENQP